MPLPPFPIPDDVREWVRSVFSSCNARVTGKLDRLPTTHETSLDLSLIEALSQVSAPVRTPSGHLVRIDVHFLGGGRHFGTWEVADIGALLIYRSGTEVVRTKVALLQSKRLYPIEQAFEEDSPLTYATGFGRLNTSDENFSASQHNASSHSLGEASTPRPPLVTRSDAPLRGTSNAMRSPSITTFTTRQLCRLTRTYPQIARPPAHTAR